MPHGFGVDVADLFGDPAITAAGSLCLIARKDLDQIQQIVSDDVIMNAETLPKVEMPNRDGFMPDHRPEHFPPVAKTPHQSLAIVPAK